MRISDWSSDVCSSDLFPRCRSPVGWMPEKERTMGGHRRCGPGIHHEADTGAYRCAVAVDVETPVFQGPFDLLLHLILQDQVDLYAEIGRASCRERVCQYV